MCIKLQLKKPMLFPSPLHIISLIAWCNFIQFFLWISTSEQFTSLYISSLLLFITLFKFIHRNLSIQEETKKETEFKE